MSASESAGKAAERVVLTCDHEAGAGGACLDCIASEIERQVAAAVAEEREACARAAEATWRGGPAASATDDEKARGYAIVTAAEAIRSRGGDGGEGGRTEMDSSPQLPRGVALPGRVPTADSSAAPPKTPTRLDAVAPEIGGKGKLTFEHRPGSGQGGESK